MQMQIQSNYKETYKHIKWSHLSTAFQLEQRWMQSLQVQMRTASTSQKYKTNTHKSHKYTNTKLIHTRATNTKKTMIFIQLQEFI